MLTMMKASKTRYERKTSATFQCVEKRASNVTFAKTCSGPPCQKRQIVFETQAVGGPSAMKSVFTFVSKAFFEPMHVPILPRQSRDRDHQTTWVGKCVLYLLRQAVSELEANASCGTIGYARVATWILDLTYLRTAITLLQVVAAVWLCFSERGVVVVLC